MEFPVEINDTLWKGILIGVCIHSIVSNISMMDVYLFLRGFTQMLHLLSLFYFMYIVYSILSDFSSEKEDIEILLEIGAESDRESDAESELTESMKEVKEMAETPAPSPAPESSTEFADLLNTDTSRNNDTPQ